MKFSLKRWTHTEQGNWKKKEEKSGRSSWQRNGRVTSALGEWQDTQQPTVPGDPGSKAERPGPSEFCARGEVSVTWGRLLSHSSVSALIRQTDSDVVWSRRAKLADELAKEPLPSAVLVFLCRRWTLAVEYVCLRRQRTARLKEKEVFIWCALEQIK